MEMTTMNTTTVTVETETKAIKRLASEIKAEKAEVRAIEAENAKAKAIEAETEAKANVEKARADKKSATEALKVAKKGVDKAVIDRATEAKADADKALISAMAIKKDATETVKTAKKIAKTLRAEADKLATVAKKEREQKEIEEMAKNAMKRINDMAQNILKWISENRNNRNIRNVIVEKFPVIEAVALLAKGNIMTDDKFQRPSGQWTDKDNVHKSDFIRTLIEHGLVEALTFNVLSFPTDGKAVHSKCTYSVVDGKQRFTTAMSFISNEWALSKAMKPIVVDGVSYDVAGKKFYQLDESLQARILGFEFNVNCLYNHNDADLARVIKTINDSVHMSKEQIARMILGGVLVQYLNKISASKFMTEVVNFTDADKKSDASLKMIFQAMMLANDYDFAKFDASANYEFASYLSDTDADENRIEDSKIWFESIGEIVDYLGDAFDGKTISADKTLLPFLMVVADDAIADNIEPTDFLKFYEWFTEKDASKKFSNSCMKEFKAITSNGGATAKKKAYERLAKIREAYGVWKNLMNTSQMIDDVDVSSALAEDEDEEVSIDDIAEVIEEVASENEILNVEEEVELTDAQREEINEILESQDTMDLLDSIFA